jgi:hypothetical protein
MISPRSRGPGPLESSSATTGDNGGGPVQCVAGPACRSQCHVERQTIAPRCAGVTTCWRAFLTSRKPGDTGRHPYRLRGPIQPSKTPPARNLARGAFRRCGQSGCSTRGQSGLTSGRCARSSGKFSLSSERRDRPWQYRVVKSTTHAAPGSFTVTARLIRPSASCAAFVP